MKRQKNKNRTYFLDQIQVYLNNRMIQDDDSERLHQ